MEHSPTGICSTCAEFSRQERLRFMHGQLSSLDEPTVVGETPGLWVKCSCICFNGASKAGSNAKGTLCGWR
jgi:hypothetical protein